MKDFTPSTKNFSEKIPILEVTDTNHADNVNTPTKKLLENDLYLNQQAKNRGLSVVDGALCITFNE